MHAEINDMLRARLGKTPLKWILTYSCVVADDMFRIPRSRRRRHLAVVGLTAVYSSLRWNRAITFDLRNYLVKAIAASRRSAKHT